MNNADLGVIIAPFSLSAEEAELVFNSFSPRFQDIPIVHFLKAEHFRSLLIERRLLLKRADTYPDDPKEATYPEINRIASSHADAQIERTLGIQKDRDAQVDAQTIVRSLSYVHCWHEGDQQSPHMWQRYGDNNNGVCIQSSTQALQAAVGTPPQHLHCEVGKCTYWDENHPLPEMVSSFPAFCKRKNYVDEQEIRLLARIKPAYTPTDPEGHIALPPQFESVPVDLQSLIHSVTFGSSLSLELRAEFSNMLAELLPEERILIQQ